jgi:SMC interacting uncharacterized protein involved in chromosome segregation
LNPGHSTNRWALQAEQRGEPTFRNVVRADIDLAIKMSMTDTQFYRRMKEWGYTFNFSENRKFPTLRAPAMKSNMRLKTLGENYAPEQLSAFIENRNADCNALTKERERVCGRLRAKSITPEKAETLRAERDDLSVQIKTVRNEVKLATAVSDRWQDISEKIRRQREFEAKQREVEKSKQQSKNKNRERGYAR